MKVSFSDIVQIALAAHALAMVIVNLTPTPKDNETLGTASKLAVKWYRAIEMIAGIVTPLAKR